MTEGDRELISNMERLAERSDLPERERSSLHYGLGKAYNDLEQFEEAMRRLLDGIESRRAAVITGRPPTIEATIPSKLQKPIADRVQRALEEKVPQRIWRRDPSLWGGPGPEIEDRLGWLTVCESMLEHAPEPEAAPEPTAAQEFTLLRPIEADEVRALERVFACGVPHGEIMSQSGFDAVWITPQHWRICRSYAEITRTPNVEPAPPMVAGLSRRVSA